MSSIFPDLANKIHLAWDDYQKAIYQYTHQAGCASLDIRVHTITIYNAWINASHVFKGYGEAIREFTDKLSWNNTIEVKNYGDIIGIDIPGCALVFINAYTGRDPETALCRYGDDHKMFMRIGGLPVGTRIYTPDQRFYEITEYQVATPIEIPRLQAAS